MQVILDSSFARPGSAPIWGGKKVEFMDWTMISLERMLPILWPFRHRLLNAWHYHVSVGFI